MATLYDTNKCLSMVLKEKKQTFVRGLLLFTHTCPVTKFTVASHLFKYGKFLLPPRFLTALSVLKVS